MISCVYLNSNNKLLQIWLKLLTFLISYVHSYLGIILSIW